MFKVAWSVLWAPKLAPELPGAIQDLGQLGTVVGRSGKDHVLPQKSFENPVACVLYSAPASPALNRGAEVFGDRAHFRRCLPRDAPAPPIKTVSSNPGLSVETTSAASQPRSWPLEVE